MAALFWAMVVDLYDKFCSDLALNDYDIRKFDEEKFGKMFYQVSKLLGYEYNPTQAHRGMSMNSRKITRKGKSGSNYYVTHIIHPKDADIDIALKEANHQIQFSVADNGIGISADEKKKVFDKFYRTGDENTRMTKGTGLGLYLCKKIVETHKGYISVTDNLTQGTIFTASFTATNG